MSGRVSCVKCAADKSIAEEDRCALTQAQLLTIDGMTVISVCPDCNHKFSAHHVDGKVIQQAVAPASTPGSRDHGSRSPKLILNEGIATWAEDMKVLINDTEMTDQNYYGCLENSLVVSLQTAQNYLKLPVEHLQRVDNQVDLPSWKLDKLQRMSETEWQALASKRIRTLPELCGMDTSRGSAEYHCYKLPSSTLTKDLEQNLTCVTEKTQYANTARPDVAATTPPPDVRGQWSSDDGNRVEMEVKTSYRTKNVTTAEPKPNQSTSAVRKLFNNNRDGEQGLETKGPPPLSATCFQVLTQAFERVIARAKVSGYRKRVFAFAVSNKSAWMVDFYRDTQDRHSQHRQHVRFTRLSTSSVDRLWHVLVRAPKDYMYIEKTDNVFATLDALQYNRDTTRVRWHAFSSQAFIYQLTPAVNGKVSGKFEDIQHTIKVFLNDDDCKTEISALAKYKAQWDVSDSTSESEFYATQCLAIDCKQGTRHLMQIGEYSSNSVLAGVLLMKTGAQVTRQSLDAASMDTKQLIYQDILRCLHMLHKTSICHCDIRRANILNFNGKYVLIDLGLSTATHTKVVITCSKLCGQFLGAGQRVRSLAAAQDAESVEVEWIEADDVEMLVHMLYGKR